MPDNLNVVVYSKADCPDCTRTKEQLTRFSVPFSEVRIDLDSDARDRLVQKGVLSAPFVEITHPDGSTEEWSAFRYDRIRSLGLLYTPA